MKFHILGLAHTKTNLDYCACAYTAKILKLCTMLKSLGHDVIHYGAEGSKLSDGVEHVTVISDELQRKVYGGYDFKSQFFKWNPDDDAFKTFNANASIAVKERSKDREFLLCMGGSWHSPVAFSNNNLRIVEPGIGYRGVFAPYRVFESYAWMHHVYGLLKQDNGSWYDAVIPNYFDPSQFKTATKKDYYLYFGRLIPRKGLQVVSDVAERLKIKVICVGQGKLKDPQAGADNCNITSKYLEHIGSAGVEERKEIMAGAIACFLPTYYLEPFGGVAVEAQMSGTPVITSDWGAFPETVQHGVTGYRCRTLDHFLWAAKNAPNLSSETCRKWAIENYSTDRVKYMYEEYFNMINNLNNPLGWYTENADRKELDWLKKYV